MGTFLQLFRNRALLTFMLGHFTVDMYGGLLPVLYPLMAREFDLSSGEVGLIALAYTSAGSLSQPAFGYIADRFGSRYLAPACMVWAAVLFAIVGFSPTKSFLLTAAFLGGLGSGAYHPVGASNASAAAGEIKKNTAMSVYTVAGTFGYALGPILGAVIFGVFGRYGSVVMIPLGFLSAALIFRSLLQLGLGLPSAPKQDQEGGRSAIPWRPLMPVMAVVMLRSWALMSLVNFIPLWYSRDLGYSASFYGPLTTAVIGFGSVGTLLGGIMADRFGERRVLILSLSASIPPLLLFANVPGPIAFLSGPLFGLLADMSISPTLVMAQRLLPGRIGMASGFILGMGFVTGGIGVPITGYLVDQIGAALALMSLGVLLLMGVAATFMIPGRAFAVRSMSYDRTAPTQAD